VRVRQKTQTGSSVSGDSQGAILASCGGEAPTGSVGDIKSAFVPGSNPRVISETIIVVHVW
jgi:hypothetical protein